ncbi:MAG: ferrous iron transport protein B [Myxococcota bacterium]
MSTILLMGTPNAGKSTLFNTLTGANAHVGNFAGTTVDLLRGRWRLSDAAAELIDVPGTFSLACRSPEERVAFDALTAHERPDLVLFVADAPRLSRSLYLLLQILELEVPVVVALNLVDEARAAGQEPDADVLADLLGVPVVATVARSGEGCRALAEAASRALQSPVIPAPPQMWSEALDADAERAAAALPSALQGGRGEGARRALGRWALLSLADDDADLPDLEIAPIRAIVDAAEAGGRDLTAELVGTRYAWIDASLERVYGGELLDAAPWSDRVDRALMHPLIGSVAFLSVMTAVFMALFSWSDPAIGLVEAMFGALGGAVAAGFDAGIVASPGLADPLTVLRDLVVDGIIGGVGAVLVFLPQIALLFFFLAILEDCGYLARASHVMDRLLRLAGLPAKAFVPLLSGYACAVPAILATRTLSRRRDRVLTMMVIPLTSCSARLPVYTLVIATLFPTVVLVAGVELPLQPLALLAMYLFSTAITVFAAVVLGKLLFPMEEAAAVLELPPYRMPHPRTVGRLVWSRSVTFLREAGRVILVATVVLWALLYFPRHTPQEVLPPQVLAAAPADADLERLAAPYQLEASFGGQLGHAVEPLIRPLGFDWKIGVGLVGAFAAREVFVSTMGVVYGIGSDIDEQSVPLRERMRRERHADGSPVYTPLVGASLMVFFALAMQCLSTLGVLVEETGGWRWPTFVVAYMTALAWVAAFVVYQGGLLLGYG